MDSKLFYKESVLPVTLFCSALMFSPIEVAQVNAATNVVQQAKTVKGTVVDNIGEPVIGASVKVVGTTNGAVTDLDGNFALTNVPKNATVEISYIGYTTQKVSVAGKSDLKVTLQEDNKALDEVVVVGYRLWCTAQERCDRRLGSPGFKGPDSDACKGCPGGYAG